MRCHFSCTAQSTPIDWWAVNTLGRYGPTVTVFENGEGWHSAFKSTPVNCWRSVVP